MSNYGYRDYFPWQGRFTTVDPIKDGFNCYAYCENNPVSLVDLWGLSASDRNSFEDIFGMSKDDLHKLEMESIFGSNKQYYESYPKPDYYKQLTDIIISNRNCRDVEKVTKALINTYYDDPNKRQPVLSASNKRSIPYDIILRESNPLIRLGAAMYMETALTDMENDVLQKTALQSDYINKTVVSSFSQRQGAIDGVNYALKTIDNFNKHPIGRVTLIYTIKKRLWWSTVDSWTIKEYQGTINFFGKPECEDNFYSRKEAIKYLKDNKEMLKDNEKYKNLQSMLNIDD